MFNYIIDISIKKYQVNLKLLNYMIAKNKTKKEKFLKEQRKLELKLRENLVRRKVKKSIYDNNVW